MAREIVKEEFRFTEITAGNLYGAQLVEAPNTFFWSDRPMKALPSLHPVLMPEAILKRLLLNRARLNGLSTHVVNTCKPYWHPEVLPTMADLAAILSHSNGVNRSIGLPPSTDLIVRTRKIRPPGEALQKLSSPALLVSGVESEEPCMKLLGTRLTFTSLEEFYSLLRPGTNLIVHDDNFDTQSDAIHGCFAATGERQSCVELMLGTGILHARQLNEELATNLRFLHLKGDSEGVFHHPDYVRGSQRDLYPWAKSLETKILGAYRRVVDLFGPGVTMEFRYYRNGSGCNDNFHVLDVLEAVR